MNGVGWEGVASYNIKAISIVCSAAVLPPAKPGRWPLLVRTRLKQLAGTSHIYGKWII